MTEPVLQARGLEVTFRAVVENDPPAPSTGSTLSSEQGEIVALGGASGCGKTTLSRTLLGLEKPSGGEVLVSGRPLEYSAAALKKHRRSAQLVLQDPTGALNPRRSVYEAVAEGLRVHKFDGDERGAVADALSRAYICRPRSGSSFATRTSCPVGSGSVW